MEALTRSLRVSNVVNDGCEQQNLIKLQFQGLGSKMCKKTTERQVTHHITSDYGDSQSP
jgi:hypothetical protein